MDTLGKPYEIGIQDERLRLYFKYSILSHLPYM